MQEAFEWGDYYSDRHMDKCWFLDEPPKEFASRYPIMEKSRAAATRSKRSRARQDPWFTISFYIQN